MNTIKPELSLVIPVFNESSGITNFVSDLMSVVTSTGMHSEIILVDDGSNDDTFYTINELNQSFGNVKGLRFTRNFGKEAALLAGLEAASGDAVITLDSDGQHPPDLIPEMIVKWREGAKVVHGVKSAGSYENSLTRMRARVFNTVLSRFGHINTMGSSDFKLLDREAVDVLVKSMPEHRRFYRGLADWMGFPSAEVPFTVRDRETGSSKWSTLRLMSMAGVAIISFTSAPLRIITFLGVVTMLFGVLVGLDAIISVINGKAVSGFATIIISLLLIGSFIMISLGIIGEYIAKIYDEIKDRPVYILQSKVGFDDDPEVEKKR